MNASSTITIDEIISKKVEEAVSIRFDNLRKELSERLPKPGPEQGPKWMTAKDFCKRYNTSRTTLWRMQQSGKVEVLNGGGRFRRFRWKEGIQDEGN